MIDIELRKNLIKGEIKQWWIVRSLLSVFMTWIFTTEKKERHQQLYHKNIKPWILEKTNAWILKLAQQFTPPPNTQNTHRHWYKSHSSKVFIWYKTLDMTKTYKKQWNTFYWSKLYINLCGWSGIIRLECNPVLSLQKEKQESN